MRSMTGFGRGSVSEDGFSIVVEIKTVNNRFMDVNLRLPAELQVLEGRLKKRIGARIARGRVEVTLQYDRRENVEFELNRPLIAGFVNAMKEIQTEFGLAGEPDLNVIARLPNVVSQKQTEPGPGFLAAIEGVFDAALDDLEAMRDKEGEGLAADLAALVAAIDTRLPLIEAEAAKVTDEFRQRLEKRVTEMLARTGAQIELDQGRLAQELAYLAERADISEEIVRLKTHLDHFREIMTQDRDVGKRLDFLTQELNREANTISSKTTNMTVKENALAIKSEIEKIREQVQNVE